VECSEQRGRYFGTAVVYGFDEEVVRQGWIVFSTRCILWSFRPSRKRSSLPFDRGLKITGLLAGVCDGCLTIRIQNVT